MLWAVYQQSFYWCTADKHCRKHHSQHRHVQDIMEGLAFYRLSKPHMAEHNHVLDHSILTLERNQEFLFSNVTNMSQYSTMTHDDIEMDIKGINEATNKGQCFNISTALCHQCHPHHTNCSTPTATTPTTNGIYAADCFCKTCQYHPRICKAATNARPHPTKLCSDIGQESAYIGKL